MQRIAFIITHPIQYYVPLLKGLSNCANLELKVFYTWGEDSIKKFDPSYNRVIEWDIPLLNGYDYEFLLNIAKDKGSHHHNGIINPDIINRIENYNPNKIVVFGWNYNSHLRLIKKFHNKIPIYFRGDSHLLNNDNLIKSFLRKLYLTRVYKNIDFAISVGKNNHDYYKWLGLKDKQILFAPHAIDTCRFLSKSDLGLNTKYSKLNLGIPENHTVFVYCGSFEPRKNLPLIIEAKRRLKDKNCTLLIVGNGAQINYLKSLASDDKNIHFLDFVNQSELPYLYRLSDVLILFSSIETWGLVINEAMTCDCAIIASDKVGASIDLVQNNGFIVPDKNVDILSEKLKFIVDNPAELSEFKKESKRIIQNWSMDELISKFTKILMD